MCGSVRPRALLLVGAACIGAQTPLEGQQPSQAGHDSAVVVLLGTGMPRPDPDASGPATAVVVRARVFLVDAGPGVERRLAAAHLPIDGVTALRSEEHTSELQSLAYLVCRLLLEKKKKKTTPRV